MTDSSVPRSAEHTEHDGHRHLQVVQPAVSSSLARRYMVVALSVVAAGLFALSLSEPWWQFKLYAPQYPRGLTLIISLTGVGGDAHEIDTLNHYIGMAHLDAAAALEREYAAYLVGGLAITVMILTLVLGKKLGKLIVVAGALFPLGFIADSFYWLYRFGHNLDPRAPLNIPPFTPQLFGNGEIGQFMTFALPQRGFWIAVGGVVVLLGVVIVRGRVCATCKQADTCGAVCKSGFISPHAAKLN